MQRSTAQSPSSDGPRIWVEKPEVQYSEVSGLLEQVRLLSNLLDSIPSPIFYKDLAGVYLGCNRAFEIFLGKSRAQIVGKTAHDLFAADLANRYHAADLELIRQGGIQTYEGEVLYADNTRHTVVFHKAVLSTEDGMPFGMIGTILDITERRRAEQALQEQAQLLNDLSTPLLRISDTTVLLPLIGKLNAQRAEQFVSTMLHGVAANRAQIAIVDVSGVATVDMRVARMLSSAAQALQLLGTQMVITGIRPDVAHMLVREGVKLTNMIVCSTLQSGIAYALDHAMR